MQGLERLLESVEGIFGLSGVYRALIVIAGQIPSTLRIIMILSPRANDISVYKLKKKNFHNDWQGKENALQYTGAGMDTERVDLAYTWHNANDSD